MSKRSNKHTSGSCYEYMDTVRLLTGLLRISGVSQWRYPMCTSGSPWSSVDVTTTH